MEAVLVRRATEWTWRRAWRSRRVAAQDNDLESLGGGAIEHALKDRHAIGIGVGKRIVEHDGQAVATVCGQHFGHGNRTAAATCSFVPGTEALERECSSVLFRPDELQAGKRVVLEPHIDSRAGAEKAVQIACDSLGERTGELIRQRTLFIEEQLMEELDC